MNRRDALARASAEHRRAVADCSSAIRSLEPGQWREPARPGGWTRAEIAEHLAIAYGPPLSELSGGPGFAVRLPWWKWRLLRWKVLPSIRRGGFPKGAPAPREIRPPRPRTPIGRRVGSPSRRKFSSSGSKRPVANAPCG